MPGAAFSGSHGPDSYSGDYIMKIYTKTGDAGQTGLANGTRVFKDHLRVELYGTSDELNSVIGLGLSFLQQELQSGSVQEESFQSVEEQLHAIQSLLFELGAELAGFPTEEGSILQSDVDHIESWIDDMNRDLPEMKQFILPGGEASSAQFHIGRTVCRRLERLLVHANRTMDPSDAQPDRNAGGTRNETQLNETNQQQQGTGDKGKKAMDANEILGSTGMIWVNRLSDYLFVLARHCQRLNGGQDIPWKSRMQRPSRKRK